MPVNMKYFILCIAAALLLCATQIIGSTILIMLCLLCFMVLLGWACAKNYTLPILLFFLPWSQLLRTAPDSFSFYTFGLILICAISILKKNFCFRRYQIVVCILLLSMSVLSKIIDGSRLSLDYICFMMMLLLLPVVKEERAAQTYDFYHVVVFFTAGVILAALCAQQFAEFPNIARYIRVDNYLTITRMCGFYGDPNFYTAQITAAMAGCLVMILKEVTKPRTVTLTILLFLLLYCGFLSGSKSFVLISAAVLALWIIELLRMRGRTGLKFVLIFAGALIAAFIATSAMFGELIQVMVTRLSYANDMSSFTTGRTDLWKMYIDELLGEGKLLLLGKGFTNAKINGRASHNTVLQMVFQFGLLGVPVLLAWTVCFFRDLPKLRKRQLLNVLVLLAGTFVPWLAIDAMFFDEYFLLQWYAFIGLQQLCRTDVPQALPATSRAKPRKRSRLRLVWRE